VHSRYDVSNKGAPFHRQSSYLPSSAEYYILSAEEETPELLGARLHLMSDDIGDRPVMIALPCPPSCAHAAVARRRRLSLTKNHKVKNLSIEGARSRDGTVTFQYPWQRASSYIFTALHGLSGGRKQRLFGIVIPACSATTTAPVTIAIRLGDIRNLWASIPKTKNSSEPYAIAQATSSNR
jgi:hypothetical protein